MALKPKTKPVSSNFSGADTVAPDIWEEPVSTESLYLQPEAGVKLRIHLLRAPFGLFGHYVDKLGFILTDGEWRLLENGIPHCDRRGDIDRFLEQDPIKRYVVPVVVYDTGKDGQVTGSASKIGFKIKILKVSGMLYGFLKNSFEAWQGEFAQQDLILPTTKKAMLFFDKPDIAPKGALSKDATLATRINEVYDEQKYATIRALTNFLGRTMTLDELKQAIAEKANTESTSNQGMKSAKNPNSV